MTTTQILGAGMFFGAFLAVVAWTFYTAGWRVALPACTFALTLTAVVGVGAALMTGELSVTSDATAEASAKLEEAMAESARQDRQAELDKWAQTEPGLVEGMPNDIYHRDPWVGGSVSNSDAQLLLEAPALFAYRREHRGTSSRSQNLGSAAHTRVLGEGDRLVKVQASEYRTDAARKAKRDALAAGQIPLLGQRKYPDKPCEWDVVDAMAEALERDPLAPYLFADGRAEVSAFWIDPETDVPRRARFDWLRNKVDGQQLIFPDYKTSEKSVSPRSFGRSAADYGYDMQAFTYESALAALDVDTNAQMVFVLQSVTAPYLVAVHQLTQRARERGHARTLRALRRYKECVESGHWWGFEGIVHPVDLPMWAYYDEESAQAKEVPGE